jgi:lipopolysaccharide/colanic/teichoic acid biosynthesis glycosyltransferase
MIKNDHPKLSVRRQCKLLAVNRNRLAPRPTKLTEEDELLMRDLDVIYTKWPFYGQRKLMRKLRKLVWVIGRKRIGRNGKPFGVLKFATMLKDSPNLGTGTITKKGDSRVLPLGKFLRKTKLNEIPQLWNIFIGDMSIVGPRPLTKETRDYIPAEILDEIQDVQPGLTGIGSIFFRDEETIIHESGEDYHEFYQREIAPFKGEVELWYKKNRSFFIDLKIIFLTAWVVIFSDRLRLDSLFSDIPRHPIFNPEH